jgi:hypothetical protein
MNATCFDAVTRSLASAPSRRDVLRGLAGMGLGLGMARWPSTAETKKKRTRKNKKKAKKAKRNAFGCVNVGGFCKNDEQCCSGICDGKKEERKCKAHGTGTCDQEAPGLCTAPNPALLKCNNSGDCACIRTTAGSNFCYSVRAGAGDCADCQQDADCEALDFPLGSACAPTTEGGCAGLCETGMACLAPCGYQHPEPE